MQENHRPPTPSTVTTRALAGAASELAESRHTMEAAGSVIDVLVQQRDFYRAGMAEADRSAKNYQAAGLALLGLLGDRLPLRTAEAREVFEAARDALLNKVRP